MLNNICEIVENVQLTNYNTYKINAKTKYLALPKSKEEIIGLIKYLKANNIKYFILGNGSNVILPDNIFNGVVICLKNYNNYEIVDDKIIASAGAMIPKIANDAINISLKGLEWATGIPGTIGGSVVGNAGAYLHEIMEFVESVEVLDKDLNIKKLDKKDITYDYRYTNFKDDKSIVILSVTLKLEKGNKEESLALVKDRLERRQASQPLGYPSAGSVFRNPSSELPAGKIIEELGFKGKIIGGAIVSKLHANFILNNGNATSNDIKSLIKEIQDKVLNSYDINLKCEQEIVEWD
ncbi:MAG: UDP-N-acetylmuramate dehydrogenase [Bacilli bacterium]|nr:UDP-N-acetylmuramate dehydrogenase [Bacilli bacterium]